MSHTANGLITAPIDVISDVSSVLIANNGDVGYLCSNGSGSINKWSRHKPVRYDKVGELTDAEFKSTNYGLDLSNADRRTYKPLDETWRNLKVTYLPPGTNDWKRITDFNNYSKDAQPPISAPGEIVLSALTTSAQIAFANYGLSQTTDLTVADFPFIADYYPCLIISFDLKGTTDYLYVTAANKFSTGTGLAITVSRSEILDTWSNVKYFMCGCSAKKTGLNDTNVSCHFITLPSDTKLEGAITKVSISSQLELTANGIAPGEVSSGKSFLDLSQYQFSTTAGGGTKLPIDNTGTVSLKVTFKNKTGAAINVKRVNLFFKPVNNLAGSTLEHISVNPSSLYSVSGTTLTKIADSSFLSVPANGTAVAALTFSGAALTGNNGSLSAVVTGAETYMQIIIYYGTTSTVANQVGSASFNVKKS